MLRVSALERASPSELDARLAVVQEMSAVAKVSLKFSG